ncbi:PIG-L family deacetylase [Panacibacter ginsenosidivorans]|uniref:PIG-L family deacetylase n=1 Tax=Panacibacter ginsenosidivorans TaxID=1813871 RepID=A0A5B8VDS0_9BACT|nr:PIG-L deacetylase family protein [Panacibacter ginsenosidivorans]QEC69121.1 PIG-L family deacetylase [Panacibacter ginsenosidivorans]
MKTAIAIAAHPDDIEMMMAGTLLLLKKAGYEIHYLNLSRGDCGSVEYAAAEIKKIRLAEAKNAAHLLGAHFHPPLCDDLQIFYGENLLRKVAAVIREVKPTVVLTHSPEDYMEDHVNTGRLAVTAAFARGMRNFTTDPQLPFDNYDCTVYHSLPHTLRDNFRRRIIPGAFVNTGAVHETKLEALRAHQSQQSWLDVSQNMNSYLQAMEDVSLEVGEMSKIFTHAEGWRRHSHVGFCEAGADPLKELGNDYLVNEAYEKHLEL